MLFAANDLLGLRFEELRTTVLAGRVIEDHDCNTLRFRLDPQGNPVDLEPGMTAWIED